MEARALARGIRVSPKRARLVIDLVRNKKVSDAEAILKNQTQKSALPVYKVLKSAIANAENNLELDPNNLYLKEAYVDNGPTLKRIKMGSRGRVDRHDHKTCHITIVVAEKK